MPRAMLLPSYLGGGFGHISRMLALSEAMQRRGWESAFALGGHHVHRVEGAGNRVFRLRKPYEPRTLNKEGPAFTIFSDFSFQLLRDGLNHPKAIRAALIEQIRVVRKWNPDLLVSDAWPLASLVGKLLGIPVIQIVRTATHPASPSLIWWQGRPDGLIPPDPTQVFNPLLDRYGFPEIEKAEDLLRGDFYLVPSIPELDPLPEGLDSTRYVGPLIQHWQEPQQLPDRIGKQNLDKRVVYVTLGGGAGPVGGPSFYKQLYQALGDLPVWVIASTGAKLSPRELPPPPSNFKLEQWVTGAEIIARSDLVVYPGGYGTTMELVHSGVPGLVIPFHTEQESNGRRLEAAGAGRVLLPVDGEPRRIQGSWAGGTYAYLVYPHSSLTAELIRSTVEELLESVSYRTNALSLKKKASEYGGSVQAAGLIDDLFANGVLNPKKGWERLSWTQKLSLKTHLL
jgi:UDP:flavonoid glycosyltransferase YjiC (YdhE family)